MKSSSENEAFELGIWYKYFIEEIIGNRNTLPEEVTESELGISHSIKKTHLKCLYIISTMHPVACEKSD